MTETFSLYVALGDSFSAGTGCEPGEAWPDQLAERLRGHSPMLELRNLAIHGATSADILHQLPEAIELEPNLATVVCGANDVLRTTRPSPDAYGDNLERIFDRLLSANPTLRLVTATGPEHWEFLGLRARTRARVEDTFARFNQVTREVAEICGVPCLDIAKHKGLSVAEFFSADGLHPSAAGHALAARAFAGLFERYFGIGLKRGGTNAAVDG